MMLGIGIDLQNGIIHFRRKAVAPPEKKEEVGIDTITDPNTAVHNKERDSKDDEMNRNKLMETIDGNDFGK